MKPVRARTSIVAGLVGGALLSQMLFAAEVGKAPAQAAPASKTAAEQLPHINQRAIASAVLARVAHERKGAEREKLLDKAVTVAAETALDDSALVLALANLSSVSAEAAARAYEARRPPLFGGRLRVIIGGAVVYFQVDPPNAPARSALRSFVEAVKYVTMRTGMSVPGLSLLRANQPIAADAEEAEAEASELNGPLAKSRMLAQMAARVAPHSALQTELFDRATAAAQRSPLAQALLAARLQHAGRGAEALTLANQVIASPGPNGKAFDGLMRLASSSQYSPTDFVRLLEQTNRLLDLIEWGEVAGSHLTALHGALREREQQMPLSSPESMPALVEASAADEKLAAQAAEVVALLPRAADAIHELIDRQTREEMHHGIRALATILLGHREALDAREAHKLAVALPHGFYQVVTLAELGPAPPRRRAAPVTRSPGTPGSAGAATTAPAAAAPLTRQDFLREAGRSALAEADPSRRLLAYASYASAAMREPSNHVPVLRELLTLSRKARLREGTLLPVIEHLAGIHPDLPGLILSDRVTSGRVWEPAPAPSAGARATSDSPIDAQALSEVRVLNARFRRLAGGGDAPGGFGVTFARHVENSLLKHRLYGRAGMFPDGRGQFTAGMTSEKSARLAEISQQQPLAALFLASQLATADRSLAGDLLKRLKAMPWFLAAASSESALDTVAAAGRLGDFVFQSAVLTPADISLLSASMPKPAAEPGKAPSPGKALPAPSRIALDPIAQTYAQCWEIMVALPDVPGVQALVAQVASPAQRDRLAAAATLALLARNPGDSAGAIDLALIITDPFCRSIACNEIAKAMGPSAEGGSPILGDANAIKKALMQALGAMGYAGPEGVRVSADLSQKSLKDALQTLESKSGVPLVLEGSANPTIDLLTLAGMDLADGLQYLAKRFGLTVTRLGTGFVIAAGKP